jgi:phosphoglycolate phosphatase-like HAD superfamily hydrolase
VTEAFRHVVLDWDGTVVDSLGQKAAHAAEILAPTLGVSPAAVAASYGRHSGVPRRILFNRIASELCDRSFSEAEYAKLSEDFTTLNLAGLEESSLQAGAAPTIRALSDRGALLAVSSATPAEELVPRVEQSGLASLFDQVLASRPGFAKGPQHIAFLSERWQVPPGRILCVGDEIADAALARSAGAKSALVVHTLGWTQARAAQADHVLEGLPRLLDLCAGGS